MGSERPTIGYIYISLLIVHTNNHCPYIHKEKCIVTFQAKTFLVQNLKILFINVLTKYVAECLAMLNIRRKYEK